MPEDLVLAQYEHVLSRLPNWEKIGRRMFGEIAFRAGVAFGKSCQVIETAKELERQRATVKTKED